VNVKTKTLPIRWASIPQDINVEKYYQGELFRYKPRKKKHKVPIFYVPGFGSTPDVAIKAIKKMASDTGRGVVSYYPAPGELKLTDDVADSWDPMQVHNGVELVSAVHQAGFKQVDVVGHSQGALSAILAAQIEPSLIRNMILVAPAGFVEKDSHWAIVKRMIRNGLQYRSLYKKGNLVLKKLSKNSLKYLFKYKMRAWHEGLSLADQRITKEDLARLTKDGTKVALILSNDDKIFPYELISNSIPESVDVSFDKDKKRHPTIHSSILFDEEMINTVIANLKRLK